MSVVSESFKNTLDVPDDIVKQLRIESFEEFSKAGIPTRKQEYWKFSDPSVILNLNLKNYLLHLATHKI